MKITFSLKFQFKDCRVGTWNRSDRDWSNFQKNFKKYYKRYELLQAKNKNMDEFSVSKGKKYKHKTTDIRRKQRLWDALKTRDAS